MAWMSTRKDDEENMKRITGQPSPPANMPQGCMKQVHKQTCQKAACQHQDAELHHRKDPSTAAFQLAVCFDVQPFDARGSSADGAQASPVIVCKKSATPPPMTIT